jgi:hypothetical protein
MEESRGDVRRLYFAAILFVSSILEPSACFTQEATYVEEKSGERPASPE